MAIPIVDFPKISVPEVKSPWANALENALNTYGNLQTIEGKGYENLIQRAKSQYAQPMELANLQKAQAEPNFVKSQTDYNNAQTSAVPSEIDLRKAQTGAIPSEINLRQAQAGAIPSEIDLRKSQSANEQQAAIKQGILNQNLPAREKAEIAEAGARAHYYSQGGGRGGTGTALENAFQQSVLADNPQINDPEKQRELINVVSQGGDHLSDGTRVNPMSDITRRAYDRSIKSTSTAQAVNQSLQANQAAAEYPVVQKNIKEGVYDTGYGTTIWGKSPQQLKDMASPQDHKAQERLGSYISAQQMLYDQAALNLKINGLPAGQRIASKITELAKQTIDAKYPYLSSEARQIAAQKTAKTLKEILDARNKYGLSVSKGLSGNKQNTNDPFGIL
jgi:hypothetical protein